MAWIGSAVMGVAGAVALFCVAAPSTSDFLTTVMQTNLAEVRMGQLAEQNGSPPVRAFGKMLVTDHTAAELKAEALAKSLNIAIPGGPDAKAKADYDTLSGLKGAAFDSQFTQAMIDGHKQAIALFTSESSSGEAKVAKFAADTLPTLKHHLKTAGTLHGATAN